MRPTAHGRPSRPRNEHPPAADTPTAGLRTPRHFGGMDVTHRCPTGHRFPGLFRPSAYVDGCRSRSPLRGSPGFAPGSLLSCGPCGQQTFGERRLPRRSGCCAAAAANHLGERGSPVGISAHGSRKTASRERPLRTAMCLRQIRARSVLGVGPLHPRRSRSRRNGSARPADRPHSPASAASASPCARPARTPHDRCAPCRRVIA